MSSFHCKTRLIQVIYGEGGGLVMLKFFFVFDNLGILLALSTIFWAKLNRPVFSKQF